jgi:dihydroorotate dehydrogenase electron transfer subunit
MKNSYKTTKIIKIEQETPKVKNFILDKSVTAKPGQYVMVWIPRVSEKPFSIVTPSPLTLSIAKVGPFTEMIHQLKIGDKISFRGPYGKAFKVKGKKIILVGGGYGVVPLYFLVWNMEKTKRKNMAVIIGARTKAELPFVAKFKKLGCLVKIATDDGSTGFKGFTPQLMEKFMKTEKFDSVYTCGPVIMMKKIAEICHRNKIFCQVSMESFFKCGGIGLCGECSYKGRLVCKGGPIFDSSILID